MARFHVSATWADNARALADPCQSCLDSEPSRTTPKLILVSGVQMCPRCDQTDKQYATPTQ